MEIIFIIAAFVAGVILHAAVTKYLAYIKAKTAAEAQALATDATVEAKKL
jgi:hypothetical protein